jgi:hypothetical protein
MFRTDFEISQTLKNIRLKDGETLRINCPFCGGSNTFTITRKDGARVWNCYKASCTASGGSGDTRSLDSLKNRLKAPLGPINGTIRINPSPVPRIVSGIENHPDVIEYLESVHSLPAILRGLAQASYAPKENRVLFWTNEGRGAVGRALDGRKPKWKVYGDATGLFKCGTGPTAVVVEDAASACAVGILEGYTGVALLGTHLDGLKKRQLMSFDRVIFCLDNDASRKSISLVRKLEAYVPTTIRFLRDDIKWMPTEKVKELLK